MKAKTGESIAMQLVCPSDLTGEEKDQLWGQDICMDDWDYMLLIDPDELIEDDPTSEGLPKWLPVLQIERLLTGRCSNEWYVGTFRGKEYGIGIAYHS